VHSAQQQQTAAPSHISTISCLTGCHSLQLMLCSCSSACSSRMPWQQLFCSLGCGLMAST
jgi:hypothetical protein